jgi:hypothetical protein
MKALRQIQNTVLSWAVAWAVIGLALGIIQLLRTGQVSWIPAIGLGATAAGLGVGVLYACLMLVTDDWRDSLADTPGFMAQAGPLLLCGAGAGMVAGLLAGGINGALFFGALGVLSAAVFNWRIVKDSLSSRAVRSKTVSKAKRR